MSGGKVSRRWVNGCGTPRIGETPDVGLERTRTEELILQDEGRRIAFDGWVEAVYWVPHCEQHTAHSAFAIGRASIRTRNCGRIHELDRVPKIAHCSDESGC